MVNVRDLKYVNDEKTYKYLKENSGGGGGGDITVDDSMSSTSTNPVQNKVITNALNGKADSSSIDAKEDVVNKVTAWSSPVNDNQYPSAKLVKDSLDNLNIPVKTSDILNDGADGTHPFISDVSDKEDKSNKVSSVDVFSTDEQYPSAKALFGEVSKLGLTIEKQGTAEDGFASTYVFSQGGVELPTKINIPKDSFFKSVTVRVCEERGVPLPELYVGDKYIDFLVATVDGSDTHLYLAARNFLFVPDEISLTVNESGVMSVKANGVGPSRLMDGAVGYEKLNHNLIGDSLTIDNEKCLLTARQGKLLNDKKIDKSDIIDDLESEASTHVLSARQGKVLDEKKIDKISIVDDLTSDDSFKVLSAKQGKVLETNKIDKGSIVDNLTTDDSSKVLSARQGKILYDLISGIEEDMLL